MCHNIFVDLWLRRGQQRYYATGFFGKLLDVQNLFGIGMSSTTVDNGCRYPKFPIGMQASSRICIPHKVFLDPAEYSIDECLTNHASSLGCGCGNKTQLFSFLVRCISLKHDEIIENIVPRYEFLCFNSYQDLSSRVFFFFFISLIRNKD